ncbi:hypothetical protein [Novosphingopyxis sp.]|uniref:hypothetical protein n=1 Tax=Novosphingopyxis sp. TaxID=2709690 RepID=UPI003B5C42B8
MHMKETQMVTPRPIEVSVFRLSILRAYYVLMAVGTMAIFWPDLISHTNDWGIDTGAQYSLLGALTPFALLGLRYPLKMLPIILYEFAWKALWFIFVVAPLWSNDAMTEGVWANVFACGIAIVLTPIVLPWRYFWQVYVAAPTDRWR